MVNKRNEVTGRYEKNYKAMGVEYFKRKYRFTTAEADKLSKKQLIQLYKVVLEKSEEWQTEYKNARNNFEVYRHQHKWNLCNEKMPKENGEYTCTIEQVAFDGSKHRNVENILLSNGKWVLDFPGRMRVVAWHKKEKPLSAYSETKGKDTEDE